MYNDNRVNLTRTLNSYKNMPHSIRTSKYVKQILTDLDTEIDNNKKIGRDFNIPFRIFDKISRKKINRDG